MPTTKRRYRRRPRKRRKRTTKKGIKKYQRFNQTRLGFNKVGGFLASTALVKHVYASYETLTSGSETNVTVLNWSANSLYDPYISGVGHQPMGRDEVATLYNNYHVQGGKIEILFYTKANAGTQEENCVIVGCHIPTVDNDGTFTDEIQDDASLNKLVEQDVIFLSGRKYKTMQHAYAGKPCRVTRTWNTRQLTKNWMRNPSTLLNNPNIGAESGANPTTNLKLQVFASAFDGGNHVDVGIRFKITYYALWSDPVAVGQS